MGFDLDYFVKEGGDNGDFQVIEFCIRTLVDDYLPEVEQYIPQEKTLLRQSLSSLVDIMSLYCVLIEARHKKDGQ